MGADPRSVFNALSQRRLADMMWAFGQAGADPYSRFLKLLPDRRIGGYSHKNETYWQLRPQGLMFLNEAGQATTIFNKCFVENGVLHLSGYLAEAPQADFRHFLRETPEPLSLCDNPSKFLIDKHFDRPRRRNLVIMGANEASLHHQWEQNIQDADRSWDLALSFYGDVAHYPPPGIAEYTSLQTGVRKWLAIHAAFHEASPFWAYERILVMDDDILTSWRDINYFFEICRDYNLLLAQPSLKPGCAVTHGITSQVAGSFLRYTSFVEAMAPCFTAEALRVCIAATAMGHYGFGIDHIWPKLLGYPKNKIAIVDAVAIDHTRPLATTYQIEKAKAEEAEILALYEIGWPYTFIWENGRVSA